MANNNIRVRIAPSPTGNLHVGTARTALFNYLFAKKNKGKFILRIEDTDLKRSKEKYTQNIYESLKSMGLNWDEGPDIGGEYGPYKQSDKLETYKNYAQKLVKQGKAYYCWCQQDEIEKEKNKAAKEKISYKYSRKCKNLTQEQVEQYKVEGREPAIRFCTLSEKLMFDDIVRGQVEFDTNLIDDFVIIKSNGTPTYNFAVVIDDMEMKISHVIRGEDHISNTPKQILIYKALDRSIPVYAHVGMILAPDRSKLSKRHGATAVSEFIAQGYLPEAFVNFLSLLGWSPADNREILELQEIINLFKLEKVSPSPAIFELDKLNWMNGQYIKNLSIQDLTDRARNYFKDFDLSIYSEEQLSHIIDSIRKNLVTLNEIPEAVVYFFGDNVKIDEKIQKDVIELPESQQVLNSFKEFAHTIDYGNLDKIHNQLADFRKSMTGLKPKQIMWAVRAALSGRTQGADIAIIVSLLGKGRVLNRVDKAIIK